MLGRFFGSTEIAFIGYTKKGKAITVRIACIKKMMKLVTRKWSDNYRSVSLDDLAPHNKPSVETKESIPQDYTVENITENLYSVFFLRNIFYRFLDGFALF